MDYENKYKNALERAKKELFVCGSQDCDAARQIFRLFPELKENKDERIRRELIRLVYISYNQLFPYTPTKEEYEEMTAWLEKQGEQNYKIIKGKNYFCVKTHNYAGVEWIKGTKYYASDNYTLVNQGCEYYCPEYSKEEHNNLFEEVKYDDCVEYKISDNKLEPKFKVGDWICNGGGNPCKVNYIFCNYYELCSIEGYEYSKPIRDIDANYHLWTIEDAKDGDVLTLISGQSVFIFDGHDKEYCHYLKLTDSFSPNPNYIGFIQHQFVPATKEQRELLFNKMKEAGYEWSEDTHQLKKIEPKFKMGDWLVWRDKCYKVNYNGCGYELVDQNGLSTSLEYGTIDENAHLWTIADAKDGDVLCGFPYADFPWIGIFHELNNDCSFNSYCYLQAGADGKFCTPSGMNIFNRRNIDNHSSKDIVPATKEQRNTLFKKMREAGYWWDEEKKELKNIESKFHEGDWLQYRNNINNPCQIISINDNWNYIVQYCDDEKTHVLSKDFCESYFHLWTIADANDGDMIFSKSDGVIGIFQSIGHHPDGGSYNDPSYCFLHCRYDNGFIYADFEDGCTIDSDDLIPATKEQHDILFQKMREAGYEWDAEKKELKKTEQKGGEQ